MQLCSLMRSAIVQRQVAQVVLLTSIAMCSLAFTNAAEPAVVLANSIRQAAPSSLSTQVKLVHGPEMRELHFSRDESVLYSLANNVRAWETTTGQHLRTFTGPVPFQSMAVVDGGRWIVTVDAVESSQATGWYYAIPRSIPSVRLWEAASGKSIAVRQIEVPATTIEFGDIHVAAGADTVTLGLTFTTLESPAENSLFGKSVRHHNVLQSLKAPSLDLVRSKHLERGWLRIQQFPGGDHVLVMARDSIRCIEEETLALKWTTTISDSVFDRVYFRTGNGEGQASEVIVVADSAAIRPVQRIVYCFDLLTGVRQDYEIEQPLGAEMTEPASFNRPSLWVYNTKLDCIECLKRFGSKYRISAAQRIQRPASLRRNIPPWKLASASKDALPVYEVSHSGRYVAAGTSGDEGIHVFDLVYMRRTAQPNGTVAAMSIDSFTGKGVTTDGYAIYGTSGTFDRIVDGTDVGSKISAICYSRAAETVDFADSSGRLWEVSQKQHGEWGKASLVYQHNHEIIYVRRLQSNGTIILVDSRGRIWSLERRVNRSNPKQLEFSNARGVVWSGIAMETDRISMCPNSHGDYLAMFAPLNAPGGPAQELPVPGESVLLGSRYKELDVSPAMVSVKKTIGVLYLFDLRGNRFRSFVPVVSHKETLISFKKSDDDSLMAMAFESGFVMVINVNRMKVNALIDTRLTELVDVDFGPHKNEIVAVTGSGRIEVWNAVEHKIVSRTTLRDARLGMVDCLQRASQSELVLSTRDAGIVRVAVDEMKR